MRTLLLSIFYTVVFVLLGTVVNKAWAITCSEGQVARISVNIQPGANGPQSLNTETCEADPVYADALKSCKAKVDEASKTKKELLDSCSEIASAAGSGETKTKCTDIAIACASRTKSEMSSAVLGMVAAGFQQSFPSMDFNSTCQNADMTLSQWEKNKDKAKSELEKKKEKFEKLQEDSHKLLENANKAKQELAKKTQEEDKKFQEAQHQAEIDGDKEAAAALQEAQKSEQALRDLQSKNLALTQAKAAKLQERAAMFATMSDALVQTDCLEKIQKFIREFNSSSNSSIVAGGASSAFNAANTGSTVAQTKWQACLAAAYAQRDATLKKYQNEVEAIDQEQSNLNEQYKSAQKAIQSNDQLRYKSNARLQAKKAQDQTNYQQAKQSLVTEYTDVLQQSQAKNQQLQGQLQTVQTEIATTSNELAGLDARRPEGDKKNTSAVKAAKNLEAEISEAKTSCDCECEQKQIKGKDKNYTAVCNNLCSIQKTLNDNFDLKEFLDSSDDGAR